MYRLLHKTTTEKNGKYEFDNSQADRSFDPLLMEAELLKQRLKSKYNKENLQQQKNNNNKIFTN